VGRAATSVPEIKVENNGTGLRLGLLNFARTRSFTRRIGLFALLVASAAAFALPPAPAALFRDNAGAVTADFGQRLEGELQELDRDTKGRLIVAIFAAPEGDVEEFASRTAAGWERAEPKLEDGAILFYFTKTQQARVWTGAGLAARLPSGALDKRLTGIFRGPAAFVTYPDSIEKSVSLFSAEIRNALEASQPRSAVSKLKWKISSRIRLLRAGAGAEFGFLLVGALLVLVVGLRILWSWYRTVGETIAAGERKHETAGQIALDMGKEAGIGAAKIAAGLALEAAGDAIGGGASGGGGGFSGGGGSFGGGGASGSW
jgi:uncharacterized protein